MALNPYREMYRSVEAMILSRLGAEQRIHGSTVRDIFIEFSQGRFAVDDQAEKLLRVLVEEGVLVAIYREPTVSQSAFAGLGTPKAVYAKTPWGPGTIEHYWYARA